MQPVSRRLAHFSAWIPLSLLLCLGCANPILISRPVHQDLSWFVRLDSYQDANSASARYQHPVRVTDEELTALLSRLLLEDRAGLMDSPRPPRPVFTIDEISLLAPGLAEAFRQATPQEWVSFYFSPPGETTLAVTSGGLFIKDDAIHVVLANHRLSLSQEATELSRIRANPFYSVKGSGGALAFEASRFVTGRQANWTGGHQASASELILDHRAFFSFLKRSGEAAGLIPSASPRLNSAADPTGQALLQRLQEEVAQLKKKVAEQEAEIDALKRRADRHPAPTPRP